MSRCLLSLLLVAAIGFVSADDPEKLVGANNAAPGEFPYTVSIRVRNSHFCGGAIISNRHIITAAHCVEAARTFNMGDLTVVSGTNYLNYGGQSHRVAGLYAHPQYGGPSGNTWLNDVGIIKLAAPMAFNNVQNMIAISDVNPPAHINALVSAWGNTAAPPRGNLSASLQKLFLRVIPLGECQQKHRAGITNAMICTFNQVNVGTCSGDSGSPLTWQNRLIGVVSGGIPCARGYPDIFTNVVVLRSFVQQAMSF